MVQLNEYRGYLYNTSHLLAWSLGGDMQTHNVTLGTRAKTSGRILNVILVAWHTQKP